MNRQIFKRCAVLAGAALWLLNGSGADAAAFTAGDLAVLRLGTTGTTLATANTAAVPMFLDEYRPTDGALIQSIALSGGNTPFTGTVGPNRDGIIQLSQDGRFISVGGYNVAAGTANPVNATTKIIARVGVSGVADYSTSFSNVNSGNPIRSVASKDGSGFWYTTDGASSLGYIPFGGTSATDIDTGSWRATNVANGNLYAVSGSSGWRGVSQIGSGLPTSTGSTVTTLTASPNPASGPGVSSIYFADANTIYAAGSAIESGDDFREYHFESGSWVLKGDAASPDGASSAYGVYSTPNPGGGNILYLSTYAGIYKVIDTDPTDGVFPTITSANLLVAAPADTVFRGLAAVPTPEPGSASLALIAGASTLLRRRRRSH